MGRILLPFKHTQTEVGRIMEFLERGGCHPAIFTDSTAGKFGVGLGQIGWAFSLPRMLKQHGREISRAVVESSASRFQGGTLHPSTYVQRRDNPRGWLAVG